MTKQGFRLVIYLILFANVSGCQSEKSWVSDLPKPHIDPSVMAECGVVVDIPHRFLPDDETTRLWAQDRASLGACGRLNHAKGDTIKALIK